MVSKTQIENTFIDAIDNNPDINAFLNGLNLSNLTVVRAEDYNFVENKVYPKVNIFCLSKQEDTKEISFTIVVLIMVERNFDNDNIVVLGINRTEQARITLDDLSELILKEVNEHFRAYGVNGNTRFELTLNISETAEPNGENDFFEYMEIKATIDKCLLKG